MPNRDPGSDPGPERPALSEREALILRSVVRQYVETAAPVGSKALAERRVVDLSSASIRATLSALESLGYLDHPHTSAGRVPTDLGYRAFVDELMERPDLSPEQARRLRAELDPLRADVEALMRESSRLLGELTSLLGVVLSPRLATGVLEKIEAVPLTSERLMFVVAVRGGLVKTIVAELDGAPELSRPALDRVVATMNERLAGLTLEEVRRTAHERMRDLGASDATGVVRLVLHQAEALFSEVAEERQAERGGAGGLVTQPEFQQPEQVQRVLELLENDDVLLHLLDTPAAPVPGRAVVLIGRETGGGTEAPDGLGGDYSVVKASYRIGGAVGSLGVIGPRRMDYGRAVALVESLAALIGRAAA